MAACIFNVSLVHILFSFAHAGVDKSLQFQVTIIIPLLDDNKIYTNLVLVPKMHRT